MASAARHCLSWLSRAAVKEVSNSSARSQYAEVTSAFGAKAASREAVAPWRTPSHVATCETRSWCASWHLHFAGPACTHHSTAYRAGPVSIYLYITMWTTPGARAKSCILDNELHIFSTCTPSPGLVQAGSMAAAALSRGFTAGASREVGSDSAASPAIGRLAR